MGASMNVRAESNRCRRYGCGGGCVKRSVSS